MYKVFMVSSSTSLEVEYSPSKTCCDRRNVAYERRPNYFYASGS